MKLILAGLALIILTGSIAQCVSPAAVYRIVARMGRMLTGLGLIVSAFVFS